MKLEVVGRIIATVSRLYSTPSLFKWVLFSDPYVNDLQITRLVYNLFQEPVEQPPLVFSIAEEKSLIWYKFGWSELAGNFFYWVILKGIILPTCSLLFLFCSFLGDFFEGVGGMPKWIQDLCYTGKNQNKSEKII